MAAVLDGLSAPALGTGESQASDLQWFSSGYFLVLTAAMLPAVQADFARGMDMALLVSADIALAGIIFTLLFLPASNARRWLRSRSRTDGEAAGKQPASTGQVA
ncbi:MAG: hypothetical protein ACLPKI_15385 [Streptosporangiaceae bacterium]